uniref:CCHC-type domain-containing protein n=1 Tax=Aegilops tauschii subsp. strangulata TaxID=200361 RepID=A0A452YGG9_AEGTS
PAAAATFLPPFATPATAATIPPPPPHRCAMDGSPQSINSSFRRSDERPVVSGLGLSSDSEASGGLGGQDQATDGESRRRGVSWVQSPPSKKTLWKRRVGLEVEPGAQPRAPPARPSPSPRREVSPKMENKCFRCLLEGHYRKDCTNDVACLRCGLPGHGSRDCKRPQSLLLWKTWGARRRRAMKLKGGPLLCAPRRPRCFLPLRRRR